ncbi:hypothetical protein EDD22DRAFT_961786 [Suillus occidentalis]|nr:hypothetical protein EDD22DRAFT_961786 [Suillus occidentalis]
MTRSQHFFTIATRIDARAMQISGDVEFHLFMDMRAECAWISFKMTPRQWAVATESYNTISEKNHAIGLETVKKNPQALLRKLGEIEVAMMNCVAKNNFKCDSFWLETFWKRHCHIIELIKAEPGRSFARHTHAPLQDHHVPRSRKLGVQSQTAFADGAKQVSKNEPPPPWPQPPGIFSEGKHFHPRAFLETVKQIYEQVFLGHLTLEEGMVLFKLYEELEINESTPDALLTVHNGVKHLAPSTSRSTGTRISTHCFPLATNDSGRFLYITLPPRYLPPSPFAFHTPPSPIPQHQHATIPLLPFQPYVII